MPNQGGDSGIEGIGPEIDSSPGDPTALTVLLVIHSSSGSPSCCPLPLDKRTPFAYKYTVFLIVFINTKSINVHNRALRVGNGGKWWLLKGYCRSSLLPKSSQEAGGCLYWSVMQLQQNAFERAAEILRKKPFMDFFSSPGTLEDSAG